MSRMVAQAMSHAGMPATFSMFHARSARHVQVSLKTALLATAEDPPRVSALGSLPRGWSLGVPCAGAIRQTKTPVLKLHRPGTSPGTPGR